jgi:hypothetical protein
LLLVAAGSSVQVNSFGKFFRSFIKIETIPSENMIVFGTKNSELLGLPKNLLLSFGSESCGIVMLRYVPGGWDLRPPNGTLPSTQPPIWAKIRTNIWRF